MKRSSKWLNDLAENRKLFKPLSIICNVILLINYILVGVMLVKGIIETNDGTFLQLIFSLAFLITIGYILFIVVTLIIGLVTKFDSKIYGGFSIAIVVLLVFSAVSIIKRYIVSGFVGSAYDIMQDVLLILFCLINGFVQYVRFDQVILDERRKKAKEEDKTEVFPE